VDGRTTVLSETYRKKKRFRVGGVAEHLLSKHEALSSNSSTTKKKFQFLLEIKEEKHEL
jgi:hypothetical protein